MFTNADMTIYSLKDGKYTRTVIEEVFWNAVKESNTIKSGMTTVDSVKIIIPKYSAPVFTVTTGKDLVIEGVIDYEFDNSSQKTQSESLKHLKDNYEVVTVTSFDPKLFGNEHMQHYVLSCK